MEVEELLSIASEVRAAVRKFVAESEEEAKYGEIIGRREKDVTRRIDIFAERALEHALEKRGICAHIFSEELGDRIFPEGRKPECTLIFDPIDGSSNAAAGIPFYCSSLAYSPEISGVKFEDLKVGVVVPIFGGIYHAVEGSGAYVDGKKLPLKFKGKDKLMMSIYTYGKHAIPKSLFDAICEFQRSSGALVRVFGSVAVELCFVASGVLDAVLDVRGSLNGYDIAASLLILKEAGGVATDLAGREIEGEVAKTNSIPIVAARNEELLKKLHTFLRGARCDADCSA